MQKYARVKSCEKVLLERFMVDSRLISSQVLEEFVWWYVSCTTFSVQTQKRLKKKKDAFIWYDAKKLIFFEIVSMHEIDQNTTYGPVLHAVPYFGTRILLFGSFGQLKTVKKKNEYFLASSTFYVQNFYNSFYKYCIVRTKKLHNISFQN